MPSPTSHLNMYRKTLKDFDDKSPPFRGRQSSHPEAAHERTTSSSPGPVVYFISAAPLYKTRAPIVIENPGQMQESILLPRETVVKVYSKESPCFWWIQADNCNFGWKVNRAELEDEPIRGPAERLAASRSDDRTLGSQKMGRNTRLKIEAIDMDILVDLGGEAGLKPRAVEAREKHWREAPDH